MLHVCYGHLLGMAVGLSTWQWPGAGRFDSIRSSYDYNMEGAHELVRNIHKS